MCILLKKLGVKFNIKLNLKYFFLCIIERQYKYKNNNDFINATYSGK